MPTEPASVHVFEVAHLGHRPFFLAWLLADPPHQRRWVLHTTPEVLAHPALASLLAAPSPNLRIVTLADCRAPTRRLGAMRRVWNQIAIVRAFSRSWKLHAKPGDEAFIPYHDDLAIALALPGLTAGMPCTTIGMRASFHQQRQGIVAAEPARWPRIGEWLLRRFIARPSTRCHLTNQLPLKRDIDARWSADAAKVRFYPDPGERPVPVGKVGARRSLGLPQDRRYVLCYGSLTARKGVARLLEAMASPAWPEDTTAIIAGSCRDDVAALLSSSAAQALVADGRLHLRLGFADEATENLLFQATDAVWVVYDGHDFMSGCLVQAGLHHRPVIGCATGLIAWYIAATGGGLLHRTDAVEASLRALDDLLHDERRLASAGERLGEAFARHTREDFRAAIYAAILGRPDPVGHYVPAVTQPRLAATRPAAPQLDISPSPMAAR